MRSIPLWVRRCCPFVLPQDTRLFGLTPQQTSLLAMMALRARRDLFLEEFVKWTSNLLLGVSDVVGVIVEQVGGNAL